MNKRNIYLKITAATAICCFGVSLMTAQNSISPLTEKNKMELPAEMQPIGPSISVDLQQDGEFLTIRPLVDNPLSDSLACTYAITVERSTASGNTSRTSQSGHVQLAPASQQSGSTSRINYDEGDQLNVSVELMDADGTVLDTDQLSRKL